MKLRDFIPNFHIHVSVSDLWIPKIGHKKAHRHMNVETRPRSFISGNICIEFSVQCLCSVWYKGRSRHCGENRQK
jgi:hypothetical protein